MTILPITVDELLQMARAGHDMQRNAGLMNLIRQLHNEAEPALRELLTVCPWNVKRVRYLQNQVNMYLTLREKVAATIEVGRGAEDTILSAEAQED